MKKCFVDFIYKETNKMNKINSIMITEDYVSFVVSKLLKEKGFKQWCFHCYGVDVRHKGKSISFDEECDLKDEGFGNEIEYVEGGRLYDYVCNNRDKDAKVWAAPTLWAAIKWLREEHNICITIYPDKGKGYEAVLYDIKDDVEIILQSFCIYGSHIFGDSYEEACEEAIRYCLENLI